MLVPIPLGCFFLVLVADISHFATRDPFWYRFSSVAIGTGLIAALVAASFGAVDYLSLPMTRRTRSIATAHALSMVGAVALYAASAELRSGGAGLRTGRWWTGFALSALGFLVLACGGWLGGKLAYEEHLGVVETRPGDQAEEGANRAVSEPA
jgi:uncharacterized membrane protein